MYRRWSVKTFETWDATISFKAILNGKRVKVQIQSDDMNTLEDLLDIFEDLCVFDEVI